MVFTLNAIADSQEHAADEIRNLLEAMMVEVCMAYPRQMSEHMQCGLCEFVSEDETIMRSHMKVMHNK